MKKSVLAVVVLLGVASVARGAEHPGNPDRFPSIGLNFTGTGLSGDTTFMSSGFSAMQDSEIGTGSLVLDMRLPLSDNFTLNAAIGAVGMNRENKETALIDGSEDELGGAMFNVGMRWYIH